MNSIFTLVAAIQVCVALIIIGLVLVQHGKGADMGAAFGSGASGSLFGATGSSSFLSKATGIAAAIFFCSTLGLAYLGSKHTAPSGGVMENLVVPPKVTEVVPAAPATAPASTATPVSNGSKNKADQIPK